MARLTPHRDLAPVVRADVLDDGQSQTGATGGTGARGVHAVEALEDPGLLAFGDALATSWSLDRTLTATRAPGAE